MTSCGLSYNITETFNDYLKDDETKLEPCITELVIYPLENDLNIGENNNTTGNNGNQGNSVNNNIKHKNYNKSDLPQGFENDPHSTLHDQSVRTRHILSQEVRNIIYMEHKKYAILARVSSNERTNKLFCQKIQ